MAATIPGVQPARVPTGAASPDDLRSSLAAAGYLADADLAVAAWLAVARRRPLFLEGEPGVGKTALAYALAQLIDGPVVRLQCYEGIDASQALYDWDFPKQVLHLRAGGEQAETGLYSRPFLVERPLLRALQTDPCVLLIDEVDRADDEFEALLLEVLADFAITVPELGTIRSPSPPVVLLTSNRTREVHDALKRRCYYAWVGHPGPAREAAIVAQHVPAAREQLVEQVIGLVRQFRGLGLLKPPGVAESIDWVDALTALGIDQLDAEVVARTLGSVLKVHEDHELVRALPLSTLIEAG